MSEWLEGLDPRPKKIPTAEITRNERVLAAKCLREDFGGCWYAEDFRDRILDCIGGDDVNGPANMHASLADELADLIDPTCTGRLRVVEDADGRPVHRTCCSRCGTRMYGSWRYCAKCGARIVMSRAGENASKSMPSGGRGTA